MAYSGPKAEEEAPSVVGRKKGVVGMVALVGSSSKTERERKEEGVAEEEREQKEEGVVVGYS